MRIILVLVAISAAIVNGSNLTEDTQVTTNNNEHNINLTYSLAEQRLMRPVFPKSGQKFVFTTKSPFVKNTTTPVKRLSRRPVFKVIPKAVKMKDENYWKTSTTRRALMKYTKFTIDPATTFKIISNKSDKGERIERKYKINHTNKTSRRTNKHNSSEEILKTFKANDKHKDKVKDVKKLIRRFHKLHSKINKGKIVENISKNKEEIKKIFMGNNVNNDKIKLSDGELSSEEKEDREEFIFVTPKQIKVNPVTVGEDSDESDETTTVIIEKELKQRRSVNVIEEENFGTTISGFKFTGKVSSLNSDLVFRNINT